MTIEPFAVATVTLAGGGAIGLCRMPGRAGRLEGDVSAIVGWAPGVVVTLTEASELAAFGGALPDILSTHAITYRHFPIEDYGVPPADDEVWPRLSAELHAVLDRSDRVLVHCMGGCGRSGMIALRLMVERGDDPDAALNRLRAARPCAIETEAQLAWASMASQNQPAVRPK